MAAWPPPAPFYYGTAHFAPASARDPAPDLAALPAPPFGSHQGTVRLDPAAGRAGITPNSAADAAGQRQARTALAPPAAHTGRGAADTVQGPSTQQQW
ncbi:hypothetical protein PLESTB_000109700 [Pleodorina starrii]|uniref:Uncharacterized protein n=1 Tax=Pleodorina starrii TaxID=330485 RepID=A0A9W6BBL3_9CHLO|nr:hypothetical protein PLESTB_000109700 [Pleodorina starrii]